MKKRNYIERSSGRLVLIALLGLLFAVPLQGQPSKRSKSPLGQAKEHLKYEEYERAIPLVSQLVEEEPRNAYYNFWLGKCLYLTYKRNQALPYFETANDVNPTVDREFHFYYGLTLHYNLKFDQAIEEYKLDIERYKPNSPDYLWVKNRIEQCLYAKKLSQKRIQGRVEIANMGDKINTSYSEHSPVISANDSILLFTARRPDSKGAKPNQGYYDEDIYISYQKDGEWTQAKNIDKPVNGKGHDATISLNASGNKLFLYRHKKKGGLYRTDFDNKGKKWKEPKPVDKPLNSRFYEASICESADSSIMFFTSDRPGGFGGRDIYIVKRNEKGKWGDPENLGPTVNTPFDEDAPYFHPDGKTLYYSSNGPNSMGGFDIFITEFDSLLGGWLEPLNLGAQVNTPDDDIYFTVSASGKYGYFSSGKEGGFGEKDIYELEFPYFPFPRRYTIIELLGLVRDAETGDELAANVRIIDNQTKETITTLNTAEIRPPFVIELNPLTEYKVDVSADGYTPASGLVTTPKLDRDDDIQIEKTYSLTKIAEETAIAKTGRFANMPAIQHIYFDFDKANLRPDSKSELDMVTELLEQNPDLQLQVAGHADYHNTFDYNQLLSERRAKSAYQYLLKKGVNESQLILAGLSENKPLETNQTDEGRQYNRRVEFEFYLDDTRAFSSVKLRQGSEGPIVDHTKPKGAPGYDNPEFASGAASASGSDQTDTDEPGWLLDDGVGGVTSNSGDDVDPGTMSPGGDSNDFGSTGLPDPDGSDGESGSNVIEASLSAEDLVQNIYFDFDAASLRNESENELQKVRRHLEENPGLELEIMGHTDSYGNVDYNQRLSDRRANAAYAFLVKSGIDGSRITISGFSELKPIDNNSSNGGRQLNRRVEFKLSQGGKTWMKSVP